MITFAKYTNIGVCVFDKNLLKFFLYKYDKYDAISFNIITSYTFYHCADSLCYIYQLFHISHQYYENSAVLMIILR